jgi:hypothetical protein
MLPCPENVMHITEFEKVILDMRAAWPRRTNPEAKRVPLLLSQLKRARHYPSFNWEILRTIRPMLSHVLLTSWKILNSKSNQFLLLPKKHSCHQSTLLRFTMSLNCPLSLCLSLQIKLLAPSNYQLASQLQ